MEIKLISVSEPEEKVKGKNSWSEITITYGSNKGTQVKKLLSFNGDVYNFFVTDAEVGSYYEVTTVKEGEFWQWKDVVKKDGPSADSQTAEGVKKGGFAGKTKAGDWETSEERAKKQVYIVRQSSVSNAIAIVGAGSDLPTVLKTAQGIYDWVFEVVPPARVPAKRRAAEPDGDIT